MNNNKNTKKIAKRKSGKRNACVACYKSRVKCVYEDENARVCKRCAKTGRDCIVRVALRGHASKFLVEKKLKLKLEVNIIIIQSFP